MDARTWTRRWAFTALAFFAGSSAHAATVTLAWDRSPETNVAGYRVDYGTSPGIYTATVDVGNLTSRQFPGLTDGTPYYFIVRAYTGSGVLSAPSVEVSTRAGIRPLVTADFTGDYKTDLMVYRPSSGTWFLKASDGVTTGSLVWGASTDLPVAGDYDGNGQTDIAVYRPSTGVWYIRYTPAGNSTAIQWGATGDIPVPGDYDGDGKTDVAVFRPSNGIWYVLQSSNGQGRAIAWGTTNDVPTVGDYDGDGYLDLMGGATEKTAISVVLHNERGMRFTNVAADIGLTIPDRSARTPRLMQPSTIVAMRF